MSHGLRTAEPGQAGIGVGWRLACRSAAGWKLVCWGLAGGESDLVTGLLRKSFAHPGYVMFLSQVDTCETSLQLHRWPHHEVPSYNKIGCTECKINHIVHRCLINDSGRLVPSVMAAEGQQEQGGKDTNGEGKESF